MTTEVTTDDHELAKSVRLADQSLRKTCAGLDIEDVLAEVTRSMKALDIHLDDAALRDYAQHIADRADHELVLP